MKSVKLSHISLLHLGAYELMAFTH